MRKYDNFEISKQLRVGFDQLGVFHRSSDLKQVLQVFLVVRMIRIEQTVRQLIECVFE